MPANAVRLDGYHKLPDLYHPTGCNRAVLLWWRTCNDDGALPYGKTLYCDALRFDATKARMNETDCNEHAGMSPLAPGQWQVFLVSYATFFAINNVLRLATTPTSCELR